MPLPLLLLALHTARAEDVPVASDAATESTTAISAQKKRNYLMEVNFRGRYLFVPDSLLDIWYESHSGGGLVPARPRIEAYSLGLDFVVRDKQANGIFYAEYVSSLIKPGYWDDRDNPPDDADGSWIEPEMFGLVLIGANYAYEIKANNWFSVMVGAGLGIGIKTGQLVEWEPGEDPSDGNSDNIDVECGTAGSPAYTRAGSIDDGGLGCEDDGAVKVPSVIPVVDVNLGIRFNINDHASIRLEAGLHDLIYGGAAVGITF